MLIKDPKRIARRMMTLTVLTGMTALAAGIMAAAMRQYLIAGIMAAVALAQIWNYKTWQKKAK